MYSVGIAYFLWLVSGFGALGFHRFYLGKIPSGILWMCTGGLGMIGSVFDFFTLPAQVQEANIRSALFSGAHLRRPLSGSQPWRNVKDGEARIVREKRSVEHIILRLAKQNKGIITASELALESGLSMEEAKKALDTLVSKGFAELRVRKTGTLVYAFPELMDSDSPLEDF
jgi:TM2 domain-containing membrane protein YozV/predicted transcriptional regulator